MNDAKARTAKLAGLVVVGGLAAGLMLSVAVPTTMKRPPESESEAVGMFDASVAQDTEVMFEAPPQDLEPVRWQPAGQEYGYPAAMPTGETYVPIEPAADYGEAPLDEFVSDEPAEADIPEASPASLDFGDAAASAAQAASEAAADVRAVERVVVASTD